MNVSFFVILGILNAIFSQFWVVQVILGWNFWCFEGHFMKGFGWAFRVNSRQKNNNV